jgi:hypothetical protein
MFKVGDIIVWKGINVGKFDFVAMIVEHSESNDFIIKPLSPKFIKELDSAPNLQTGDGMIRMPICSNEWEVFV